MGVSNQVIGDGNLDMMVDSNGYGVAFHTNAGTGLYLTSAGKVGIATTSPAQALEVNGEVKVDTFASASSTTVCQNANVLSTCSSSIRDKENVKDGTFGLKDVMLMRPVTFKWKGRDEKDFGLIAEEVEKIDPLYVSYAGGKVEGVKYPQLTALLINAVKEQQKEIESLEARLEKLEAAKH